MSQASSLMTMNVENGMDGSVNDLDGFFLRDWGSVQRTEQPDDLRYGRRRRCWWPVPMPCGISSAPRCVVGIRWGRPTTYGAWGLASWAPDERYLRRVADDRQTHCTPFYPHRRCWPIHLYSLVPFSNVGWIRFQGNDTGILAGLVSQNGTLSSLKSWQRIGETLLRNCYGCDASWVLSGPQSCVFCKHWRCPMAFIARVKTEQSKRWSDLNNLTI